MAFLRRSILICLSAGIVFLGVKVNRIFQHPAIPNIEETCWGPKEIKDESINSFKINISNEVGNLLY